MADINEPIRHEIQYAGVGIVFVLPSKDDHISKTLISSGSFYERPMLEAIAPALRPGDLVVDAGANIGNHTLFFAKVLKCRVLAFEPIASTAALLEENVNINGVSDLVVVRQVALGDKKGKARIASYDPNNIGGTTLANDRRGTIQIFPLDGLVENRPVRLLKIDVEGMDLAVLKGARKILTEDRPWVICEAASESLYRPIQELLGEMGYSPTAVYNATDTFLFLPSRSDEERRALIDHAFAQMMVLQREERAIVARIEQAGRYSERMKKEAIAEMQGRLDKWGAERLEPGAGPGAKTSLDGPRTTLIGGRDQLANRLSQAELDRDLGAQAREALQRQMDATSAELEDARMAMAAEREQMACQLADIQARADEGKREVAILSERMAEARHALEEQRSSLERLTATLANTHAVHEREILEMRTASARTLEEEKSQVHGLSHKLTISEGMLARKVSELADKQRRLEGAHNALKTRDGLLALKERELEDIQRRVSNAHRVMQRQASEMADVQASLSFRLGVLIVRSLRSPPSVIALVWNVPKLFWNERRKRAGKRVRNNGENGE